MRFMKSILEDEEKECLVMLMASPESPRSMKLRAGIVLRSAAGLTDNQIAAEFVVSIHTVGKWRRRYLADGIAGLKDCLRPGKPRRIKRDEIATRITSSLDAPPPGGGRWTIRKMAKIVGLPPATTGRIWQELRTRQCEARPPNSPPPRLFNASARTTNMPVRRARSFINPDGAERRAHGASDSATLGN